MTMTLRLSVQNIGPIASAEIEIGPGITLVGAVNESGKSTLLASAAGALTCNPLVLPEITAKKDAHLMLRDGAKAGRIGLASDAGDVVMVYPAASVESHGSPPAAGPNSVGRQPFLALAEKERAQVLSKLLRAEPSGDELGAALRADGIAEDDVADILEILAGHGWDGGHDFVSKRWTELKGAWAQITKAGPYGAAKAAGFSPAGWSADLATMPLDQLELDVATAKTALDHARANQAVDSAEITRLTEIAGSLRDRTVARDELAAEAQTKHNELTEAKEARAALPSGEADPGIACPHCSGHVVVRPAGGSFSLHKADPVDGKELAKRREALAAADGTIARLAGEHGAANRALIEAQAAIVEAENAAKQLAAQKKAKKGDNAADGAAVGKAEQAHKLAAERLEMRKRKAEADEKHAAITLMEKVRAHFSPDGLRQVKLGQALTAFNDGPLRSLADAAGWKHVVIRPDMSLTSGGHVILSVSARWRAETLLAIAFAQIGKSDLVILDGADVNDTGRREGLVTLLEEAGIGKALVGMTLGARSSLPDLAAAGLGRSYWIENGVAQAIGAEKKAAA